jgi:hypothetical protein
MGNLDENSDVVGPEPGLEGDRQVRKVKEKEKLRSASFV